MISFRELPPLLSLTKNKMYEHTLYVIRMCHVYFFTEILETIYFSHFFSLNHCANSDNGVKYHRQSMPLNLQGYLQAK